MFWLLIACSPPIDRENFAIYAAIEQCDKRECDSGKAAVLSSGEDCYAQQQIVFEHFLYAMEQGPAQGCDFNPDVATEYVNGYADMDCNAFYLGEGPETSGPLWDCPVE